MCPIKRATPKPSSPPPPPSRLLFSLRMKERLQWDQVGKLESKLGVHDLVSIGDGQQSIAVPSEKEKLLEFFMAQVRDWFTVGRSWSTKIQTTLVSILYVGCLLPLALGKRGNCAINAYAFLLL